MRQCTETGILYMQIYDICISDERITTYFRKYGKHCNCEIVVVRTI